MAKRTANVTWDCPKCKMTNVDSYAETSYPCCGQCGKIFTWDKLLTKDDIQYLDAHWPYAPPTMEES